MSSWQVWHQLQQGLLLSQRRRVRSRHRKLPMCRRLQRAQVWMEQRPLARWQLIYYAQKVLCENLCTLTLKIIQTTAAFFHILMQREDSRWQLKTSLIDLFSLFTCKWAQNLTVPWRQDITARTISRSRKISVYKYPLCHLNVGLVNLIVVFFLHFINPVLYAGWQSFMSEALILLHSQPVHWSHHGLRAVWILLINYK